MKTRKKEILPHSDNVSSLKSLGSAGTRYRYTDPDPSLLETFPNQYPHRNYRVEYVFTEFSSLCPKTGQPDFATITIAYIPDKLCIETKSLKTYFLSYRQYGTFMETLTNRILEDCISVCKPRWMEITSNFNARGGTLINVKAQYTLSK